MKFETNGRIDYIGPDDPTGDYYSIITNDGKIINVGFDAERWGGDLHKGIPQLGALERIKNSNVGKRCKITIEILDEE